MCDTRQVYLNDAHTCRNRVGTASKQYRNHIETVSKSDNNIRCLRKYSARHGEVTTRLHGVSYTRVFIGEPHLHVSIPRDTLVLVRHAERLSPDCDSLVRHRTNELQGFRGRQSHNLQLERCWITPAGKPHAHRLRGTRECQFPSVGETSARQVVVVVVVRQVSKNTLK
jgi:hypothetical protein